MTEQSDEKVPYFVSAGAERALAEAARTGRDINIAGALYRKVNHGGSAAPVRRVVDGNTDLCSAPGYRLHAAVGAGAISEPYLCHGCSTWFTLSTSPEPTGGTP